MTLEVALRHSFPGVRIDVAFAAPHGITTLFGRSGAGKTTVVNAVAGLLRPDEGRITLWGEPLLDTGRRIAVPAHRRRIGYVFQEGRLFPHLTVRQNMGFGRWFARRHAETVSQDDVIGLLGLDRLLDRRPGALSGGEKQRVAIARALLAAPRLLLMDEPLASLDEPRKAEILPYLERLRDNLRIPILYVSHSVPEVARLATTIVALSDGRVARYGPAAEVLADPGSFPLMGRQEAGAILEARVVGHDPADGLSELAISGGRLFLPGVTAATGSTIRVRVRARDIMLALAEPTGISALNILPVKIVAVGPRDAAIVDVSIVCGTDHILARVTRRSVERLGLAPGLACYAVLKSVAVSQRDLGTAGERD